MKDVTVLMVFSVDGGKTFQCVAENGNGGGYAPAATPQQMRKVVSAWLATEKTEPETTLEEALALRLRENIEGKWNLEAFSAQFCRGFQNYREREREFLQAAIAKANQP